MKKELDLKKLRGTFTITLTLTTDGETYGQSVGPYDKEWSVDAVKRGVDVLIKNALHTEEMLTTSESSREQTSSQE